MVVRHTRSIDQFDFSLAGPMEEKYGINSMKQKWDFISGPTLKQKWRGPVSYEATNNDWFELFFNYKVGPLKDL